MRKQIIRFVIRGPVTEKAEAIRLLEPIGFSEEPETTPWRNLFKDYRDEELPGVALAGARYREGLTQKELSASTDIPQSHISAMENGKMTIGRARAKRLAQALKVDYRVFL
jgi:ribosome-binding protein aMBF1 (putative translation factor)